MKDSRSHHSLRWPRSRLQKQCKWTCWDPFKRFERKGHVQVCSIEHNISALVPPGGKKIHWLKRLSVTNLAPKLCACFSKSFLGKSYLHDPNTGSSNETVNKNIVSSVSVLFLFFFVHSFSHYNIVEESILLPQNNPSSDVHAPMHP